MQPLSLSPVAGGAPAAANLLTCSPEALQTEIAKRREAYYDKCVDGQPHEKERIALSEALGIQAQRGINKGKVWNDTARPT